MPNHTIKLKVPGRKTDPEFTPQTLRGIFHRLDAGQSREQIRAFIRDATGSGTGNNTIAELRKAHIQLRRSQGYAIGPGGVRRGDGQLRATPQSPITPITDLPSWRQLSPRFRARAKPPENLELPTEVTVKYRTRDGQERTGRFMTGPELDSLDQQIRDARRMLGGRPDDSDPGERVRYVRKGGRAVIGDDGTKPLAARETYRIVRTEPDDIDL